ncbi:hypothetical protein FZEAL_10689 [Fusarium zealandicum]|uniref:Uncharacterized protein n=1 Tax=Fusarium zealandicum TaxID=1053134 RepID=A0A8H4TXR7_9HYPO|nr:hypothetical protein FZEAL_10689 [Fusarium zealandicum]
MASIFADHPFSLSLYETLITVVTYETSTALHLAVSLHVLDPLIHRPGIYTLAPPVDRISPDLEAFSTSTKGSPRLVSRPAMTRRSPLAPPIMTMLWLSAILLTRGGRPEA